MGSGEGAGREVEGLGVLVQRKGAKSVMATLWSVADNSTGIFMSRFYTLLQQEGMTKAEAIRQTQREFIEGKLTPAESVAAKQRGQTALTVNGDTATPSQIFQNYEHPYFWAPFILMGNWL
jgi:CHAT domain-containing protein